MGDKLRELLQRVHDATGGDEHLDDAICATLHYADPRWRSQAEAATTAWPATVPGVVNYRSKDAAGVRSWPSVALTYSLSATLTLIDQVLHHQRAEPCTNVSLQWRGTRGWHYEAKIHWRAAEWQGYAQTPPLACLSALFGLLIALDQDGCG